MSKPKGPHNYEDAILRRILEGAIPLAPGQVNHVDILHDNDCPRLRGGHCTCSPEVRVRPAGMITWR